MKRSNALQRVVPLLVQMPFEHVCALRVARSRRLNRCVHFGVGELDVLIFQLRQVVLEAFMVDFLSQLVQAL